MDWHGEFTAHFAKRSKGCFVKIPSFRLTTTTVAMTGNIVDDTAIIYINLTYCMMRPRCKIKSVTAPLKPEKGVKG